MSNTLWVTDIKETGTGKNKEKEYTVDTGNETVNVSKKQLSLMYEDMERRYPNKSEIKTNVSMRMVFGRRTLCVDSKMKPYITHVQPKKKTYIRSAGTTTGTTGTGMREQQVKSQKRASALETSTKRAIQELVDDMLGMKGRIDAPEIWIARIDDTIAVAGLRKGDKETYKIRKNAWEFIGSFSVESLKEDTQINKLAATVTCELEGCRLRILPSVGMRLKGRIMEAIFRLANFPVITI